MVGGKHVGHIFEQNCVGLNLRSNPTERSEETSTSVGPRYRLSVSCKSLARRTAYQNNTVKSFQTPRSHFGCKQYTIVRELIDVDLATRSANHVFVGFRAMRINIDTFNDVKFSWPLDGP
jgi:hypothetical protein